MGGGAPRRAPSGAVRSRDLPPLHRRGLEHRRRHLLRRRRAPVPQFHRGLEAGVRKLRLGRGAARGGADRDQRAPVGLGGALRGSGRQVRHAGRHRHPQRHRRAAGVAGALPGGLDRRDPQLQHPQHADEDRRRSGDDQPRLVHGERDGPVRHRVRPALRRPPLQDARDPDGAAARRVGALGGRRLNSARGYDSEDKDAQWAWDWEKHARI